MASTRGSRRATRSTAVTDALVALHEHYHRRTPVTAKTQLMGDELLAVMGDIYTDVERR